jgi:hypothetical protein
MIRSQVPGIRCFLLAGVAVATLCLSGCATFSSRNEALRGAYDAADFPAADAIVNGKIAEQSGIDEALVSRSNALDPTIDPLRKDTLVYLLDKGMTRLALDDPATAVRLFRTSRGALDANFQNDTSGLLKELSAIFTDDTVRSYKGADYEHLMVRAMLALSDLVAGGGDAYAYAAQIGEKQEEIIGSPLGEVTQNGVKAGYRPREQYRRIALGAYLQGVIREEALDRDEAARAYERALSFSGGVSNLYSSALERVTGKRPTESGQGALHVFYFGGRGPYLGETRANPTDAAIRLAGLAAFLMTGNVALIAQAPVPVPVVLVSDPVVPPLSVQADGLEGATETLLDINRIAQEQLDANMPWIMARAILRRSAKAAVATAAGSAVGQGVNSDGAGMAVSLLVGLVSTATENADTRSWETLPAMIQALRLDLPAGEQTVRFGDLEERRIRIAPGRNSYVIVIRPSGYNPPAILIDRYSRIPSTSH